MLSRHKERIMAKLTDTQLIVLSKAAARDDGIAVVPAKMNKAAASKVGARSREAAEASTYRIASTLASVRP
jgi:hypothetical protein